ncbi:succinyldiaminopimelate transaminase [Acidiferrobacter sp.]|jgi:N-succinyldiaminopimelate aminotransferase|uniref:succinyldiaminopimelate transaminase n=1 Tax=Acidiferrobacter sp. TaxID=1872107 RepID=UPI0026028FFC|nr:succinyldiaminopimelate transaminase [Acidiferrobacter sp.]
MNPTLGLLHPYPFQRLAALTENLAPPALTRINMAIGEPRHPTPDLVKAELTGALDALSTYPSTRGTEALRAAIAGWLTRRFRLPAHTLDPERHVLPTSGSREALYSVVQARVDRRADRPVVIMPNPFYQIYEGAALLAGAEPYYVNTDHAGGAVMNVEAIPRAILERTEVVITCSPGNPTGQVMRQDEYGRLLELAHRYGFLIVADECYSEIYFDEETPPEGLLAAAIAYGVRDFAHCVAVHSLSKRSNVPGLRFGFVAGDAGFMAALFTLRTYFGSAPSQLAQRAAIAALGDETHVRDNRRLYREKFADVIAILDDVLPVTRPDGGFYLWARTPIDDEAFVAGLYTAQNLLALPGSYLSRRSGGKDPGAGHIRLALVGPRAECKEGAYRLRSYVESLTRNQNDTSSAH